MFKVGGMRREKSYFNAVLIISSMFSALFTQLVTKHYKMCSTSCRSAKFFCDRNVTGEQKFSMAFLRGKQI
jgi:hypothetical protein